MTMGIEKPRDHGLALAIELEVDFARTLVTAVEQLLYLAVVIDDHRRETDDLAFAVEGHPVDILDQAVGKSRHRRQKNRRSHRAQRCATIFQPTVHINFLGLFSFGKTRNQ